MDPSAYLPAGIAALLLPVLLALLGLIVFWAIIRSAVAHGLRDHQKWMERREVENARARNWSLEQGH